MPRQAKITLQSVNETLHLILARIGSMDGKFDALQISVHQLQGTVDRMALDVARIPAIELRLSALEADVAAIKVRLDNLEGLYEHLTHKVDVLYDEYHAIRAAVERLEKRMDRQDADRLAERIQLLEQKVAALEKSGVN
jgi:chromosome segregation ATPase